MTCMSSEDSDQPGHPPSLIRHPSSLIMHPSSLIRYPPSLIRHRPSLIRQCPPHRPSLIRVWQVLHTPCPEIWYGLLHMYFSGLKENPCSCSYLKSQALNFGTRSMKYIVHRLSYVDIIQKKIRDMKCEEYCPCHILRDI